MLKAINVSSSLHIHNIPLRTKLVPNEQVVVGKCKITDTKWNENNKKIAKK